LPLIKDALNRGEHGFHIVDPAKIEDHTVQLRRAGIDVDSAMRSGQLELNDWQGAALHDRHFDVERMLRYVDEALAVRLAFQ
jgi:hypothetical protein